MLAETKDVMTGKEIFKSVTFHIFTTNITLRILS